MFIKRIIILYLAGGKYKISDWWTQNYQKKLKAIKENQIQHKRDMVVCSCGEGLVLSIRQLENCLTVARLPKTGFKHKETCGFFEDPDSATNDYDSSFSVSKKQNVDAVVTPKLLRVPKISSKDIKKYWHLPAARLGKNDPKSRVTPVGLLYRLFESGGLSVWPLDIQQRTEDTDIVSIAKSLRFSAQRLSFNSVTKDGENVFWGDILQICLPGARKNQFKTNRRAFQISKINDFYLYSIFELDSIDATGSGSFIKLKYKTLSNDLSADDYTRKNDVVPVQLLQEAKNSFPTVFGNSVPTESKKIVIVVRLPNNKDIVFLGGVLCSKDFIPVESSYECLVAEKLVRESRSFRKPLRYDRSSMDRPDFVLLDTIPPTDMEVFGMNTPDYLERKTVKKERSREHDFWYWDVLETNSIPEFPGNNSDSCTNFNQDGKF